MAVLLFAAPGQLRELTSTLPDTQTGFKGPLNVRKEKGKSRKGAKGQEENNKPSYR